MARRQVAPFAIFAALALASAACSSTAKHVSKGSGTSSGADIAAGSSAAPGQALSGSGSSSGRSGATIGGNGTYSGGTTSSGGAARPPRVTSRYLAAHRPSITSSTIYIGVGYSSQAAAGDRAIGAAGAAPSYDTRNVFNAALDYANKHGGFAGRVMK